MKNYYSVFSLKQDPDRILLNVVRSSKVYNMQELAACRNLEYFISHVYLVDKNRRLNF